MVSLLLSHVALSREIHFNVAVHVIAHDDQRENFRPVYNPLYTEIEHSVIKKCDWSEFYKDVKEVVSMNSQNLKVKR